MCFLNVPIDNEARFKAVRKVQLFYTLTIGLGVGCLEGAFCLFILGTYPFSLTCLILGMMLTSLVMIFFYHALVYT